MPFIGCDGWADQALLTIGGKAMEGSFFTNHFSPEDQSSIVKNFVEKYQGKYGALPDTFSALGYDAACLLADAIQRAGSSNSQAVRDAIAKTAGFQGVTGQISLDANRNASKPGLVVTVKGGKFEIAEKIAP
jgi:branched-chain amino acid transport system substrate-binding protein